jgi:hypothetical protein
MPDDDVHLTIPADPDMRSVFVAAVAAVVRSNGMGAEEVTRAREEATAAFDRELARGPGTVLVTISVTKTASGPHEWGFTLDREPSEGHASGDP